MTKPPTFSECTICGREFGSKSIVIHERQCLQKLRRTEILQSETRKPNKKKSSPTPKSEPPQKSVLVTTISPELFNLPKIESKSNSKGKHINQRPTTATLARPLILNPDYIQYDMSLTRIDYTTAKMEEGNLKRKADQVMIKSSNVILPAVVTGTSTLKSQRNKGIDNTECRITKLPKSALTTLLGDPIKRFVGLSEDLPRYSDDPLFSFPTPLNRCDVQATSHPLNSENLPQINTTNRSQSDVNEDLNFVTLGNEVLPPGLACDQFQDLLPLTSPPTYAPPNPDQYIHQISRINPTERSSESEETEVGPLEPFNKGYNDKECVFLTKPLTLFSSSEESLNRQKCSRPKRRIFGETKRPYIPMPTLAYSRESDSSEDFSENTESDDFYATADEEANDSEIDIRKPNKLEFDDTCSEDAMSDGNENYPKSLEDPNRSNSAPNLSTRFWKYFVTKDKSVDIIQFNETDTTLHSNTNMLKSILKKLPEVKVTSSGDNLLHRAPTFTGSDSDDEGTSNNKNYNLLSTRTRLFKRRSRSHINPVSNNNRDRENLLNNQDLINELTELINFQLSKSWKPDRSYERVRDWLQTCSAEEIVDPIPFLAAEEEQTISRPSTAPEMFDLENYEAASKSSSIPRSSKQSSKKVSGIISAIFQVKDLKGVCKFDEIAPPATKIPKYKGVHFPNRARAVMTSPKLDKATSRAIEVLTRNYSGHRRHVVSKPSISRKKPRPPTPQVGYKYGCGSALANRSTPATSTKRMLANIIDKTVETSAKSCQIPERSTACCQTSPEKVKQKPRSAVRFRTRKSNSPETNTKDRLDHDIKDGPKLAWSLKASFADTNAVNQTHMVYQFQTTQDPLETTENCTPDIPKSPGNEALENIEQQRDHAREKDYDRKRRQQSGRGRKFTDRGSSFPSLYTLMVPKGLTAQDYVNLNIIIRRKDPDGNLPPVEEIVPNYNTEWMYLIVDEENLTHNSPNPYLLAHIDHHNLAKPEAAEEEEIPLKIVTSSRSTIDSLSSDEAKTHELTCYVCGKAFNARTLKPHERECRDVSRASKHFMDRETQTPPSKAFVKRNKHLDLKYKRTLPAKPVGTITIRRWNDFAVGATKYKFISCPLCKKTFLPDRKEEIKEHLASCTKPLLECVATNVKLSAPIIDLPPSVTLKYEKSGSARQDL